METFDKMGTDAFSESKASETRLGLASSKKTQPSPTQVPSQPSPGGKTETKKYQSLFMGGVKKQGTVTLLSTTLAEKK